MSSHFNLNKKIISYALIALSISYSASANDQAWLNNKNLTASQRAELLVSAMTLKDKLQQLTGAMPEVVAEFPNCFGARHISSIQALGIPTFRITNGPVGLGQNDCVAADHKPVMVPLPTGGMADIAAYMDASSAKATALPSAMAAAASFDPLVARSYGSLIAEEMNHLALHVFEAPGINLARLPVLGRNFEYFGEDPFLTGTMAVAEVQALQKNGLIAMAKHFVGNEQETNRMSIREDIDRQVLRELYLLPFEMVVKDANVRAVMCAYNYVNDSQSCENKELLTDILRNEWGFKGYVQSDFFAVKTTAGPLKAGLDHLMPTPGQWSPEKIQQALSDNSISLADIDLALKRRYTQMFEAGIFHRPLKQTQINYTLNGQKAYDMGVRSAVLLQNNGALLIKKQVKNVIVFGKQSQIFAQQAVAGGSVLGKAMGAGGGSSDVVPTYTVSPVEGLKTALKQAGNTTASVRLVLVDDDNMNATVDGQPIDFAESLKMAADADAVIVMAGTMAEEGADRVSFADKSGLIQNGFGDNLDWAAKKPNVIASSDKDNAAFNSHTVDMMKAVMNASPGMSGKTVLVLKDNAGVSMDRQLVGENGPAILEAWFPGQEDGHIVADLLMGHKNPSGKLPVTFPFAGSSFTDSLSQDQYPGVAGSDGVQRVTYKEQLAIGYRWYDSNVSGNCSLSPSGVNSCVAFPFGHGLSYTKFNQSQLKLKKVGDSYVIRLKVTNTGHLNGSEVIQVYVAIPSLDNEIGDRSGKQILEPPKRLVGFQKVNLPAHASKNVELTINPSASNHPLSVWSQSKHDWVTPSGNVQIYVGTSSSLSNLTPLALARH